MSLFAQEFSMKYLGPSSPFLGIVVTRDKHRLFLSQHAYATDIINHAGLASCNLVATPVDTQGKINAALDKPVANPTTYRSLAGALQYLTFTRPDITYAVQKVCLHMHDPRETHINAIKRILHYIQGATPLGLRIMKSSSHNLIAYTNAKWGGYPESRRSTSGYCVYLGIILYSGHLNANPLFLAQGPRGVANAIAISGWLRNLLLELHCLVSKATLGFCDDVSDIYLSGNPVQHQSTKHIELDIHSVREN
ncbi:uncharacterized mitochondrial protein AtMg00810-like [Rutidosis leptorrhynchoides]|uniref:uncharacterized mitochondrial protein AtMg00810-like n=1 Tax=Rutidosis leptorrhynchoides TaxID=125765 RepID=UPI003A99B6FE